MYKSPPKQYKVKTGVKKSTKETLWVTIAIGLTTLVPENWLAAIPGSQEFLQSAIALGLFAGFKFLRNLVAEKTGIRFPVLTGLLVLLMPLSVGCKTVSLGNEYEETTTTYNVDGSVASVTKTRQANKSSGGMFTDVKELKQDSVVKVDGTTTRPDGTEEGGGWSVAQGAGVKEVSGANQLEAFQTGLAQGNQMLGTMLPFFMQMSAPGGNGGGAGTGGGVASALAQSVLDIVLEQLVTRGVLEPVEP